MDDDFDREIFEQNINWIVFIFLIALLAVVDFVLLLLPIEQDAKNVLLTTGVLINLFFWIDSFYWLKKLPGRRYFTQYHGRLAFVGNFPMLVPLRLLQEILFFRQLQNLDIKVREEIKVDKSSQGVLLLFLFVAIVVFQTASVFILIFESTDPASTISTSGEALWWSFVTVATVGYGDYVPITPGGRIVALFLMLVGIGMFGIFTSTLSDWFRRPRRLRGAQKVDDRDNRAVTVAEMRQLLDEQNQAYQKSIAELSEKIGKLEE